MPGRTPAEAIRNYIDPLQRAVSCLEGVAKILLTQRVHRIGDIGAWILNGPDGMPLRGFGTLYAHTARLR
jgi:hypothetical protein